MPYEIRKQGSKFAVWKKGPGAKLKKAYGNRDDAIRYMRALYAAENDPKNIVAALEVDALEDVVEAAVSPKVAAAERKFLSNRTVKNEPIDPNERTPAARAIIEQLKSMTASAAVTAAIFDESKHKRVSKGKREGGRFTSVRVGDLAPGDTIRTKVSPFSDDEENLTVATIENGLHPEEMEDGTVETTTAVKFTDGSTLHSDPNQVEKLVVNESAAPYAPKNLAEMSDGQIQTHLQNMDAEIKGIMAREDRAPGELLDAMAAKHDADMEWTRRRVREVVTTPEIKAGIDEVVAGKSGFVGTSSIDKNPDGTLTVYERDRNTMSTKIPQFTGTPEDVAHYVQRKYDQDVEFATERARGAADSAAFGDSNYNKGRVTLSMSEVPNDWAVANGYADYVAAPKPRSSGYGYSTPSPDITTIAWKPGTDPEKVLFHFIGGKPAPENFAEGTKGADAFNYPRGLKNKAEKKAALERITAALVAAGFVFDHDSVVAAGYDESKHKRAPKGVKGGGRWVSKGTSTQTFTDRTGAQEDLHVQLDENGNPVAVGVERDGMTTLVEDPVAAQEAQASALEGVKAGEVSVTENEDLVWVNESSAPEAFGYEVSPEDAAAVARVDAKMEATNNARAKAQRDLESVNAAFEEKYADGSEPSAQDLAAVQRVNDAYTKADLAMYDASREVRRMHEAVAEKYGTTVNESGIPTPIPVAPASKAIGELGGSEFHLIGDQVYRVPAGADVSSVTGLPMGARWESSAAHWDTYKGMEGTVPFMATNPTIPIPEVAPIPPDRARRVAGLANLGAEGGTRADGPSHMDYSPEDLRATLASPDAELTPAGRANIERTLALYDKPMVNESAAPEFKRLEFGDGLKPGDTVDFAHPDAKAPDPRTVTSVRTGPYEEDPLTKRLRARVWLGMEDGTETMILSDQKIPVVTMPATVNESIEPAGLPRGNFSPGSTDVAGMRSELIARAKHMSDTEFSVKANRLRQAGGYWPQSLDEWNKPEGMALSKEIARAEIGNKPIGAMADIPLSQRTYDVATGTWVNNAAYTTGKHPDAKRQRALKAEAAGRARAAEAAREDLTASGDLELAGLTASAAGMAPDVPPAEWFEDPELDGPTPLTVTPEGRVFGHVASWGTCHTGIQGRCVQPPASKSQYAYFNLASVRTTDGVVPAGKITMDTGHAPLAASSKVAASHYDHTGVVAADVRAGEDEHGIWISGSVRPDLDANQARALERAAVSGDWRRIGGAHEMVGLLAVNVPGFPIPRAQAALTASGDAEIVTALVAAGIVCGCDGEDADMMLDELVVDTVDERTLAFHGRPARR